MDAVERVERCSTCNSPMRLEIFVGPHIDGEAKLWICSENKVFGGACRSNVALFDGAALDRLRGSEDEGEKS